MWRQCGVVMKGSVIVVGEEDRKAGNGGVHGDDR